MYSLPQFPLYKEPASPEQGHQVPGLREVWESGRSGAR